MTVLDAVKGRFSTRSYENRPVDDKYLTIILESARYAQSAKNLQDWKFVVVKDADTRFRLMDAAKGQRHVAQAPVVTACCGTSSSYIMDLWTVQLFSGCGNSDGEYGAHCPRAGAWDMLAGGHFMKTRSKMYSIFRGMMSGLSVC